MPEAFSNRPHIAVTMGDAAGIGPEIVLKALSDKKLRDVARCKILGDYRHLKKVASDLDIDIGLRRSGLTPCEEGPGENEITVCDFNNLPTDFPVGVDTALTGKASAEYIELAAI